MPNRLLRSTTTFFNCKLIKTSRFLLVSVLGMWIERKFHNFFLNIGSFLAQSVAAIKYTDCIFTEAESSSSQECPRYDTKQCWNFWGMRSTPSSALHLGSLWSWIAAPDRVLFMGKIELFDILTACKQMAYAQMNC